jgi:hypothetical protein
MRINIITVTGVFILLGISSLTGLIAQNSDVGKWERYVIPLVNSSYSGNPFELDVDGIFTHPASGISIQLPGYFDGNDTWKIAFMPTKTGAWTYTTFSVDPDLNGLQGSLNCIESGNPGLLKADVVHEKKWKYADGTYIIPIALRMEFFCEPSTPLQFISVADFLQRNHIQLLETRLLEEAGQWGGRHDYIFEGDWQNHQFDLYVWNRMEERMNILNERGLGAHIMFYSDNAGTPGWSGQSATEALVIRYTIARLASYQAVLFNTGIDIAEYRSQSDVNWFGQQIRNLDPYDHPVSSRYGGGSGNYVMSGQTFDSRGDQLALINDMLNYYQSSMVPLCMDDAWGENRPSHPNKNFRPEDIRRAFWKCLMVGGSGGLIRGTNGYFYIPDVESDLESEQWLKLINPFLSSKFGNQFEEMEPNPALVSNGYCLANHDKTKLLFFLMGENDRWDTGNGGAITVVLSSLSGSYSGSWFDTRTGQEISVTGSPFAGGSDYSINPPSSDDWILFFTSQISGSSAPSMPTGLRCSAG